MRMIGYLAAGILLLAGAGLLAIYLLSEPEAQVSGLPPPAVDPTPPPAVPAAPAPDLGRFQGPKAPPAPMVYAPAPVPRPDTWEAIPLTRDRSLGPVGGALRAGMEPLQAQLTGCLATPPGALDRGGSSVSEAAGDEDLGTDGIPAVVLHLETLAGQLRVVDAPVLAWAGVSDAAMGCVQAALRGKVFPAPAAQPGRKLRVVWPLVH